MAKKPLIYWDTCIFLAWIKQEPDKGPEILSGIDEIASLIQKNQAILLTSALTRTEILQGTLTKEQAKQLQGFLYAPRRNVEIIETTGPIWDLAHEVRNYYWEKKQSDELPTVTVPDAVHLASAINRDANVFYTTDEHDRRGQNPRRALIPLSGNVAGHDLPIEKPNVKQLGLHFKIPVDDDATEEDEE